MIWLHFVAHLDNEIVLYCLLKTSPSGQPEPPSNGQTVLKRCDDANDASEISDLWRIVLQ